MAERIFASEEDRADEAPRGALAGSGGCLRLPVVLGLLPPLPPVRLKVLRVLRCSRYRPRYHRASPLHRPVEIHVRGRRLHQEPPNVESFRFESSQTFAFYEEFVTTSTLTSVPIVVLLLLI